MLHHHQTQSSDARGNIYYTVNVTNCKKNAVVRKICSRAAGAYDMNRKDTH